MLKKMKLAPKLALTIGSVLTVILMILVVITVMISRTTIQNIFSEAESVAKDIQYFLENSYKTAETDPSWTTIPTSPEARELCTSGIYDEVLTPISYDNEIYLRETARSAAAYNDNLAGVGIMFEPN